MQNLLIFTSICFLLAPDFDVMGFDLTRFQGEVDEELLCPICSEVLEEPLQVSYVPPYLLHFSLNSCNTHKNKTRICRYFHTN